MKGGKHETEGNKEGAKCETQKPENPKKYIKTERKNKLNPKKKPLSHKS
jgi:hypothetical protein